MPTRDPGGTPDTSTRVSPMAMGSMMRGSRQFVEPGCDDGGGRTAVDAADPLRRVYLATLGDVGSHRDRQVRARSRPRLTDDEAVLEHADGRARIDVVDVHAAGACVERWQHGRRVDDGWQREDRHPVRFLAVGADLLDHLHLLPGTKRFAECDLEHPGVRIGWPWAERRLRLAVPVADHDGQLAARDLVGDADELVFLDEYGEQVG